MRPIVPHAEREQATRDADLIAAWYGENAYTSYLRKHGRRPPKAEAATIGKLLGGRVKAEDGRFYPPKSAAQKAVEAERRARSKHRDASARANDRMRGLIVDWFSWKRHPQNDNHLQTRPQMSNGTSLRSQAAAVRMAADRVLAIAKAAGLRGAQAELLREQLQAAATTLEQAERRTS